MADSQIDKISQINKLNKNKQIEFHVGKPNIPNKAKLLSNFSEVLESEWLSNNGPKVQELEHQIQKQLKVNHCICVCNATIGIQLAIKALNLSGEIIVPSFSFVATSHAIHWLGLKPIFCDIKLKDHLIDPKHIESLITPKTSAILAVSLWGQPCNYNEIQKIADNHNLKVIYDSAHSFGCKHQDIYLGNFGDAEVFSFHATKVFSCMEGGAITTNCDEIAEKLRLIRNFGFQGPDNSVLVGINAKMNEISAAYGLVSLSDLDRIINKNKVNFHLYCDLFGKFREIEFLNFSKNHQTNYQYVVAKVIPEIRDSLVNFYHQRGIWVRKYFHPGCHKMKAYRDQISMYPELGNTSIVSSEIILFPTGLQVTEDDIKRFADILNEFLLEKNKPK